MSQLTIAFDYDDTITAAPVVMADWMRTARLAGHRVIVVTLRRENEENHAEINAWLIENDLEPVPIFMTSGRSKLDHMKHQREIGRVQWRVDVWVDDSPFAIVNGL